MADDRVPVYLSHSYRIRDRSLNEFFWNLLWEAGFTATVDPKARPLSVPYLEYMMKRSAAFVGIVTRRTEVKRVQASPFIAFEYAMSVRAQRPRVLFIEDHTSGRYFPEQDVSVFFTRQDLERSQVQATQVLAALYRKSNRLASAFGNRLGKVGVLVPKRMTRRHQAVCEVLSELGFTPQDLGSVADDTFWLSLQLDSLDFVVVDRSVPLRPDWLGPYLAGQFVPTIWLENASGEPAPSPAPSAETDGLLAADSTSEERSVTFGSIAQLQDRLAVHVQRIREDRQLFRTHADGVRYFRRTGRSQSARVFISNAAQADETGRCLSEALDLANISRFHYRYENSRMPRGKHFRGELLNRVEESTHFVALITGSYWSSEFCREEWDLAEELAAEGKLTFIPYYLDESSPLRNSPRQGNDLRHLAPAQQAETIVREIDVLLGGPL